MRTAHNKSFSESSLDPMIFAIEKTEQFPTLLLGDMTELDEERSVGTQLHILWFLAQAPR